MLLWLLFFIAGLGVGLAAVGTMWHTHATREKEAELLFVGDQYRRAIDSFQRASRPGERTLPRSIDELLLDPRDNLVPRRHLRRPYPDPMTGDTDWVLITDAARGIVGVHSRHEGKPLKTAGFPEAYARFANVGSYRQWAFVIAGAAAAEAVSGSPASGTAGPGVGAMQRDGTATAEPSGNAPPTASPAEHRQHVQRMLACQRAMEQGYQTCSAGALGDPGRLEHCLAGVMAQHRACLAGGG